MDEITDHPKVLIAEDEENSRELLVAALTSCGYQVVSADNGREALLKVLENPPDIIISDILMPVMDGYSFCSALKKDEKLKYIPFIFYTATYTDSKDQLLALSLGADRFVVKPVEIAELLAIIEELLTTDTEDVKIRREPVYEESAFELLHNQRLQNKLNKKLAELEYQKQILQESEQRFRDYSEASADWLWETDQRLVVKRMTGGPNELLHKRLTVLATKITNGNYLGETCCKYLKALERREDFQEVVLGLTNENQQPFSVSISGKPVYDHRETFKGYRGVGRDVTEVEALIRKIEYLSTHDELTGLPNRACFSERLEMAIQKAEYNNEKIILFFIDVDQFKLVNDSLGHDAGDELLQEVSARIRRNIRNYDTFARVGADEFVLIMEQAELTDAHANVLAILKEFERPIILKNQPIFTSVSIGLSVYPEDAKDARTLVSYADLAMYRAKSKGRNSFHYYTDELNNSACEWMALENGLRHALVNHELFMVYEPQINLADGQLAGLEALVRWQHPERGLILPDKFIAIAEQSELIVNLGVWCLNEVCRDIKSWDEAGFNVPRVAVNISVKHANHNRIIDDIGQAVAAHGIGFDQLAIEITEHTLIDNIETIRNNLERMHECGVYLALDDFGTGYSSLNYLNRIPLNEVKVDRSFMDGITRDENDRVIVQAVIALAKTLGMHVCAEGVESMEQIELLREFNCDTAQGHLISMPFQSGELAQWLSKPALSV